VKTVKLAIVTTHPIQYNAPWFRLLSQQPGLQVKVFYTWSQSQHGAKYDPGFGRVINWDIPLLDGYEYEFVENIAKEPGSHHFKGINNPSLNEKLKDWQPGAILIIGWNFISHLRCMRYFKRKVPILFRGDSTLLDEQPGLKKQLRRVFLKFVYSFVDYAFYVGSNNKKYFLKHGLKEEQLHFAPHAIDNDRFTDNEAEQLEKVKAWKKELGLNNNDFVLLFAGKFESKKDPALILELAASITDPKVKFIFIGNGILESELKSAALPDKRILFLDFQNQKMMPVVYRMSDIFILPSKGPGETWGLAINEAMACARTVIASDKVGCAVDLISNKNGYVIKGRDIAGTVAFIEEVRQKNTVVEMGKESQEMIKPYSFEAIVTNIEDLINKL